MQYEPDAALRFYQVKTWQPPKNDASWGRHLVFGVVTRSAVDAIHIVRVAHPDCRIDAVNSTGVVHFVDGAAKQ
jgi:hypothetical protein